MIRFGSGPLRCVRFGAGWVLCDIELGILLPQLAVVQVDEVQARPELIRIVACTRADSVAACPDRGQVSDWEHSR